MTDRPNRTRLLVLGVVVALALATTAAGVQAANDLPSATEDGTIELEVVDETDETVTVELSSPAADVAGFQANLSYDPAVVTVAEVEFGDLDQSNYDRTDSKTGHVFVTESTVGDESVYEPTLATITFVGEGELDLAFVEDDSMVFESDADVITDLDGDGEGKTDGPSLDGDDGTDEGDGTDDGTDKGDDGDGMDEGDDGDDDSADEPADDDSGDGAEDDEREESDETDAETDDGNESNDGSPGDEEDGLPGFTIGGAVAAVVGLLAIGVTRR